MFEMRRRALRGVLLASAALLAGVVGEPIALGGGGPIFSLPNLGVKNKSGLVISFDGRGVEGNGYRPVRIEVAPWPPKPLTADRQIRLILRPISYQATISPEISQVIELPEGSTSVKATISVPQSAQWHSISIETREGGELLKDLSQDYMSWNNSYWDWTEDRPAMLFVHPGVPPRAIRDGIVQTYRGSFTDNSPSYELPNIRTLEGIFPDANRGGMPMTASGVAPATPAGQQPSDAMLLAQLVDWGRFEMLPPAELPPRWIDLSQYDVITIRLKDLQTLAKKQPEQFTALRHWLATGTLLNVYDIGTKYERLAELEKLLSLPALPVEAAAPPERRGWSPPDPKVNQHSLASGWEDPNYTVNSYPGGGTTKRPRPPRAKSVTPNTQKSDGSDSQANGPLPFLFRRAGLGCVVAMGAENPFPGKETDWVWLFNTVPDNHWKWFRRTGVSLHRKNRDYWTFLIPDVGEAPVVSFLLLVTLFAIVIGPVNYVLLGRSRRLYLLLLTVPAGALFVSLGLFTYALLTDGLSVRLRSRSVTELNQRTGEAAAWSWQSYYAAIAPSQGLIFPEDTTIFPVRYQPNAYAGNAASPSGKLTWDGGQHLTAGYLPSRTMTQFMLERSGKTTAKLEVKEGAAGQPPAVVNKLETKVFYLLLRDSRGDYYSLATPGKANEAQPAELTLTKATADAAEAALGKLADAVEPDLPRGYDPDIHNNNALSFLSPDYNWGNNIDTSAAQPLMASSLLEKNIVAALLPTKRPLDPGTYTALVESSPFVPVGVPRVRQEASLHVIRGRY